MDTITKVLPEECVATIISLTSAKDACQLSPVSPSLKAIADSDAVWANFLPSDCEDIIDQSSTPTLNLLSKKQIYAYLCDYHVLFDNGNMTLSLEKATGKKCIMVSAKGFKISSGDKPCYWYWESTPKSRFYEVAMLKYMWWLEILGSLEAKFLSANTNYGVYFIFNFENHGSEFIYLNQYFQPRTYGDLVVCEGNINGYRKRVCLDPPGEEVHEREDGWMEVEMGEFFSEDHEDNLVGFKLWDMNSQLTRFLVVEGVEFRPKNM
ncbi:hypothetical protein AAZX31_06G253400 [Glycine max]|uniref:F-box domain-containing protein n=1 Tax=Glycine max TaxID=3847 RepID=A0A0R0JUF7_SOYBN|nr:putative F-box protein PP2-B12 [Glycine max]KRH55669.1 hypothetical protein GLYMA_06G271000v4 [Glycine max]|eukprot:XP_014632570.1 putative F-box protein PP2-B12 [Glycine max]